jgi:hypothetical protein
VKKHDMCEKSLLKPVRAVFLKWGFWWVLSENWQKVSIFDIFLTVA